jgi:hypothetical protein
MKLLPSLLADLRAACASFPDFRKGRSGNIAVADFGVSAFAMFFMQSMSFLAFQRTLEKGGGRCNCQSLFGIGKIPSDNYIRTTLDGADPALLAPCFERLEGLLAQEPMRKAFGRLDGRTLIAWDGTEFFCSQNIGCAHCLTRKRSNGKTERYHCMLAATVVAPGHTKIVPLMPEFIAPQDGAEKQDCERNAVKRWFGRHHARLAPLRPVYLGDDLFACQPIAAMVKDNGGDFIFTCKENSHKALHGFIHGARPFRHAEKVRKGKTTDSFHYSWFEAVPLRDGEDAMLVNWIGLQIRDAKGRVKYSSAWVTSLPVTKHNIAEIAACARSRWKIENEGFNVMKNHGYAFEHNFGHGGTFLAMTLATMNLLAFAWHTALDILEPPWIAARQAAAKRTSFFAQLATITSFAVFPSWQELFQALATFTIPPELLRTRKIERKTSMKDF